MFDIKQFRIDAGFDAQKLMSWVNSQMLENFQNDTTWDKYNKTNIIDGQSVLDMILHSNDENCLRIVAPEPVKPDLYYYLESNGVVSELTLQDVYDAFNYVKPTLYNDKGEVEYD